MWLPFTFMTKVFAQQQVKQLLDSRMNADEPGITANEAGTRVGNNVYICDLISGYKAKKNLVKEVYIGDKNLCITALMGQGFRSIAGQPFRESMGHFPFTIISYFFKYSIVYSF